MHVWLSLCCLPSRFLSFWRWSRLPSHLPQVPAASPALYEPQYTYINKKVQFLLGHVLLHFLQVQKLRTLLNFIRQLFFKIIPQSIQLGLMSPLHILRQFISLLIVLRNLLVPKFIKSPQIILMGSVKIAPLLIVPQLHLVNPSGF